jgi:site-specific recombinase XerD
MNTLRESMEQYVQLRRNLGAKLRGVDSALRSFVALAEQEHASFITTDLALRWAQEPRDVQAATWASRLQMVRGFATWLSAMDRRTEVPPPGLLPCRYRRTQPYIYSDIEIEKLVRAASQLPSPKGLKGQTYSTIFGLLSVTGMRVSEALSLDREEVNLKEGILTVRCTKFGKSRLVPLHESTRQVLVDYARARDRVVRRPKNAAFFVSEGGTRVTEWATRYNFAKISREVGLRPPVKGCRHGHGPRLHDMRHRFAARTLVDWYRAGVDVEREMPKLATYLGHAHVSDTYWYIEAVPELLELATGRLESRKEGQP